MQPPKRQRLQPNRSIYECTVRDAEKISEKVLAFIVDKCLPFATVKQDGQDLGTFHEIMEEARSGYVRHIPSQTTISTVMLSSMYTNMKKRVQDSLRVMLQSGDGTIMFDGWRDVNCAPVVNILIRTLGESRESSRTLFLGMIYTGAEACTAEHYVEIVENLMQDYGGMDRIAGIVTDNTSACRSARNILAKKYKKLVASQDQAHVADLLMKDIGEIEWIEATLATLSPLPSIIRAFAKLNQRLRELMDVYNRSVTADSRLGLSHFADVVPTETAPAIDDPEQYEAYSPEEETARRTRAQERASLSTAIMMKPISNVRFASSEKLLEEFVRLRPVLLQLIEDEAFEDIYPARDDVRKKARQECFINPIQDEAFLTTVQNVRNIFRACRMYLRIFDGQGSLSSDVCDAAKMLQEKLSLLPDSNFPQPYAENREKLLAVVRNRCEGPFPGMKRIQVRLTSDLHTAAYLMDPYRCPVETCSQEMMEQLRSHIGRYLDGTEMEARERQSLITERVLRYLDVRNKWRDISLFQSGQAGGVKAFAENPIGWWLSGAVPSFNDQRKRQVMKMLVEFAVRTLSVSPSACPTESSFSLQGRIHTKERSRLTQDKIRQLVFLNWNGRLFRKMRNAPEDDVWSNPTRQAENFGRLSRELGGAVRTRRVAATASQRRGSSRPQTQASPVPIVSTSIALSTSPMWLGSPTARTFVARPDLQQQALTFDPMMPLIGPQQGEIGFANQAAVATTTPRGRRNRRVRPRTQRGYRGGRGSADTLRQSYSLNFEPYFIPHPQYHGLVPVDMVNPTNTEVHMSEAENEDEEPEEPLDFS